MTHSNFKKDGSDPSTHLPGLGGEGWGSFAARQAQAAMRAVQEFATAMMPAPPPPEEHLRYRRSRRPQQHRKKRSNMLIVSKRVRRKHRRAARGA